MLFGFAYGVLAGPRWPVRLVLSLLVLLAVRYAVAVNWYAWGWYAVQYAGIEGPGFALAIVAVLLWRNRRREGYESK